MLYNKAIFITFSAALLIAACKPNSIDDSSTQVLPPEDTLTTDSLIPFSYSFHGVGEHAPYSTSLEIGAQNVHIIVRKNGETLHPATIPIDRQELEDAIAELTIAQLQDPSLEIDFTSENGIIETITSPHGERTFFRHPDNQVTPPSAAIFTPLSKLVLSWKAEMFSNIPGETIDQEIIEDVGNFVKEGMSRQTLLQKFPNPNYQTDTQINYQNWNPALITNAGRKGTFAITIRLENDVIVSWSWSSS